MLGTGYLIPVICQPLVGRYDENRKPSILLGSGIFVMGIAMLSFIYSTGFLSLLVSFLTLRVGSSFFHPIGISTVSKIYTGNKLQQCMGFQSAFGNMGVLLVFLIVGPIYSIVGWSLTFIIFATIAFLDVMVTLVGFRQTSAVDVLSSSTRPVQDKFGFLKLLSFFVIIPFVSGGSYAVVLNFANLFLTEYYPDLSLSQVNSIVAGFILAAFLGAISSRFWQARINLPRSLSLSYLLSWVTITIFAEFTTNLELNAIMLIISGFTLSAMYPLTYTLLSTRLSQHSYRSGSAFGTLSSAQAVGASVLGFASAIITSTFGPSSPFIMAAGMMLIGLFSTLFWSSRSRAKVFGEPVVGATKFTFQ